MILIRCYYLSSSLLLLAIYEFLQSRRKRFKLHLFQSFLLDNFLLRLSYLLIIKQLFVLQHFMKWHIFGCAPDSWWKYTMCEQPKALRHMQPFNIINRSQLFYIHCCELIFNSNTIILTVHTSFYSVKSYSVLNS